MRRRLQIIFLRWQRFWLCMLVQIDEEAIAQHTPSLERNMARLQNVEFALDQLYAPQSLIMQALNRK